MRKPCLYEEPIFIATGVSPVNPHAFGASAHGGYPSLVNPHAFGASAHGGYPSLVNPQLLRRIRTWRISLVMNSLLRGIPPTSSPGG